MVCSELPDSEFMLKALVPGIDEDTAKKVLMEYGYCDKWRQEGWQEGLEEEKRRTARAMLTRGMDIDTILQNTDRCEP
jgi:hypothetical protein